MKNVEAIFKIKKINLFVFFIVVRYKEVVSKEKDCDEKIYVIKSGEVLVWIKMKRSNAKKHQMLLENFTSRQTASTNGRAAFLKKLFLLTIKNKTTIFCVLKLTRSSRS